MTASISARRRVAPAVGLALLAAAFGTAGLIRVLTARAVQHVEPTAPLPAEVPPPTDDPAAILPVSAVETAVAPATPPIPDLPLPTPRPLELPSPPVPSDPGNPASIPVLPPLLLPQPALPANSVEIPLPAVIPQAGNRLQSAEPDHTVKTVEQVPAPQPDPPFGTPSVPPPGPGGGPTSVGDAPMSLPLRQLALSAALGVAGFGLAPASPAQEKLDPKEFVRKDDAKDFAKKDDLKDVARQSDLSTLKTQLSELQQQVTTIKDDLAKLTAVQRDLKEVRETLYGKKDGGFGDDAGLQKKIGDLNTKLDDLGGKLTKLGDDVKASTSRSSPLGGGDATYKPLVAGKARVRVVNEYPTEVSLVVNGESHRVPANRTKDVEVGTGVLRYQLLGSGEEKTSVVNDGETVTLRVK